MTKCKLDRILGTTQYYSVFCFFIFLVFQSYVFFGHLAFYLFGPLDSVYWTSSLRKCSTNTSNHNKIYQS